MKKKQTLDIPQPTKLYKKGELDAAIDLANSMLDDLERASKKADAILRGDRKTDAEKFKEWYDSL